jgi:hypothetical protein
LRNRRLSWSDRVALFAVVVGLPVAAWQALPVAADAAGCVPTLAKCVQYGRFSVFVVTDRSKDTDPNTVIDPSGVKDSTAGLQALLYGVPSGTAGHNNIVWFPAGSRYRVNGGLDVQQSFVTLSTDPKQPAKLFSDSSPTRPEVAFPFRATSHGTDPGKQAAWLMDIRHDLINPYGVAGTLGSGVGGWDGQISADKKSLYTRLTAPFTQSDVGKTINVHWNPYDFSDRGGFTKTILGVSNSCTAIAADCKQAVTWCSPARCDLSGVNTVSRSNAVAWATNPDGTWDATFMPNQQWGSMRYIGPGAYYRALSRAFQKNKGRVMVDLQGTHIQFDHFEVAGSDANWARTTYNYDVSMPGVTEFQTNIGIEGSQNEIGWVNVHNSWGDGISPHTDHLWMHDSRVTNSGRGTINGSLPNQDIVIERNILQRSHQALIDWEGGTDTGGWWVLNNTFGGPGYFAVVHPTSHIKFDGNHSTQADIKSGTISAGGGMFIGAFLADYFIFTNNDFSATNVDNTNYLNIKTARTHIDVEHNRAFWGRGGYFVKITGTAVTNIMVADNSGTNMAGNVSPALAIPNTLTGTFRAPGQHNDPDSWWASGAPAPSIYYRGA